MPYWQSIIQLYWNVISRDGRGIDVVEGAYVADTAPNFPSSTNRASTYINAVVVIYQPPFPDSSN